MRIVSLIVCIVLLSACSSEQYDCHIITKHTTAVETKLCDGVCNPMFKISNVQSQIDDRHVIINKKDLKTFIDNEYMSADLVNKRHPDFINQMGYKPIEILQLDCNKI